jgi:hypothetical protein
MPSITPKNDLRIFASASWGTSLCLALKDFTSGDGESLVFIHEPGAARAWRRIDLPFDVMDVACAPEEARGRCDYLALASTGEVIYLSEPPVAERVNAEGVFRQIEPGKGMLSAFCEIDGRLFALGRGGQAYVFSGDAWLPLSSTFPLEADPSDHVNFLCGEKAAGSTALYFGGFSLPQVKNIADLSQLMFSDPRAFVERARREVRKMYGTLWRFEGGAWTKFNLETSTQITSFLRLGERLFFSTAGGLAGRIVSADEIEEIYSRTDQRNIAGLYWWDGRLIILVDNEIVALDLASGQQDALPVPPGFDAMKGLHVGSNDVWLVDWRGIARWNGTDWEEVPIPRALLR